MHASDASVGYLANEPGATRGQVAVVSCVGEAVFGSLCVGERANPVILANVRRSTIQRGWENAIGRLVSRAQLIFGGACDVGRILRGQPKFRTWCAIFIDDVLGKKIVHLLAVLRFVGGEDVVEAAIFADDDDHVLDGRNGGLAVFTLTLFVWRRCVRQSAAERERHGSEYC